MIYIVPTAYEHWTLFFFLISKLNIITSFIDLSIIIFLNGTLYGSILDFISGFGNHEQKPHRQVSNFT